MAKYFNVTVVPDIPASRQHLGAFTTADLLFDWTAFDIPKGGARCIGATLLVRPDGNANPDKNDFGVFFIVSSSNDTSLGATAQVNSAPLNKPSNDFIGIMEIGDEHSYINLLKSTNVATTGRATNNENQHPSFVVARNAGSDGNGAGVGYDRFYLGGLANGAFKFGATLNRINGDPDGMGTALVTDGSSMDVREHFITGDVLHAHDDAVIGTVASDPSSATGITLETAIGTGVLADDDYVYNLNPMRIILHFEK